VHSKQHKDQWQPWRASLVSVSGLLLAGEAAPTSAIARIARTALPQLCRRSKSGLAVELRTSLSLPLDDIVEVPQALHQSQAVAFEHSSLLAASRRVGQT
jgi:hypothetical protein